MIFGGTYVLSLGVAGTVPRECREVREVYYAPTLAYCELTDEQARRNEAGRRWKRFAAGLDGARRPDPRAGSARTAARGRPEPVRVAHEAQTRKARLPAVHREVRELRRRAAR